MKDNAIDVMVKTLSNYIDRAIQNCKFNKTVKGRIQKSLGSNQYEVLINGNTYTVKSRFSHAINDRVIIVVCNNNWNELYVLY